MKERLKELKKKPSNQKDQKETNFKPKTPKEFKERHYSDTGKSILEDLKKATDAEKDHRKSGEREG